MVSINTEKNQKISLRDMSTLENGSVTKAF